MTTILNLSQHLAYCDQCRKASQCKTKNAWKKSACKVGLQIEKALVRNSSTS